MGASEVTVHTRQVRLPHERTCASASNEMLALSIAAIQRYGCSDQLDEGLLVK